MPERGGPAGPRGALGAGRGPEPLGVRLIAFTSASGRGQGSEPRKIMQFGTVPLRTAL